MQSWELIARESIRDLVARYNASGDAGRFEETLALFTEDALVEIVSGQSYRGRDEIRSLFTGASAASAPAGLGESDTKRYFLRHFTATHQIDILDTARAAGRCYYAVLTDAGLDHWGRYVDRYARCGERWLFAARTISMDAAVPGGWGERASERLASTGARPGR